MTDQDRTRCGMWSKTWSFNWRFRRNSACVVCAATFCWSSVCVKCTWWFGAVPSVSGPTAMATGALTAMPFSAGRRTEKHKWKKVWESYEHLINMMWSLGFQKRKKTKPSSPWRSAPPARRNKATRIWDLSASHVTRSREINRVAQTVWVSGCACSEAMEIGEVYRCHGNCVCVVQGFGVSLAAGVKPKTFQVKKKGVTGQNELQNHTHISLKRPEIPHI